VWPRSRHGGSCAAASVTSSYRTPKRSSCSRCSITSTRAGLRGDRKLISRATSGSPASGSTRRRAGCAQRVSSSSTSRVVRGERLAIGLETLGLRNLSSQATCLRGRTCQLCGASRTSLTCLPTLLEVDRAHGARSAVAVRALPGAGRSLLAASTMDGSSPQRMRPPACRWSSPLGGGGGGVEAVGTRKVTLTIWSRLRPLPRPLAGDDKSLDAWPGSLAVGPRGGSLRPSTAPSHLQEHRAVVDGSRCLLRTGELL
jgi:hypothetical protein